MCVEFHVYDVSICYLHFAYAVIDVVMRFWAFAVFYGEGEMCGRNGWLCVVNLTAISVCSGAIVSAIQSALW